MGKPGELQSTGVFCFYNHWGLQLKSSVHFLLLGEVQVSIFFCFSKLKLFEEMMTVDLDSVKDCFSSLRMFLD
jgi:hypothetical protein